MPEMLLTVDQAATRLQLHPITIRRQIKRGEIRVIRKGRAVRIPESAIMENTPLVAGTQAKADAIINGLKNPDYRARNAAIVSLSQADAPTRDRVEEIVTRELENIPDDADFSDWRALDGEPFHFPEEVQ
jgi:excisionase family DNA binding protein